MGFAQASNPQFNEVHGIHWFGKNSYSLSLKFPLILTNGRMCKFVFSPMNSIDFEIGPCSLKFRIRQSNPHLTPVSTSKNTSLSYHPNPQQQTPTPLIIIIYNFDDAHFLFGSQFSDINPSPVPQKKLMQWGLETSQTHFGLGSNPRGRFIFNSMGSTIHGSHLVGKRKLIVNLKIS